MKHIASRDNADFKAWRSLANEAREQRKTGQTVLDGIHLIAAYADAGGQVRRLLLAESAQENSEIQTLCRRFGAEPICLRDSLFREISGVAAPTGIAAVIDIPTPADRLPTESCVLLDAVQDAGNVGSILRSAAAAGVRDVVLGTGCASAWSPKVLRAGQGAHFSLNIREQLDLTAFVGSLDMPAVATVARDGTLLYELDLTRPVAWLFGNEGAGLSPALAEHASLRATIPLVAAESLNVAAAAAICMFEGVRQRNTKR